MNRVNVGIELKPMRGVEWKCDCCGRVFPTVTSEAGPRHLLKCNHDGSFSVQGENEALVAARTNALAEGRAAGRKEVYESLARVLSAEAPDVLKAAHFDLIAEDFAPDSYPPPSSSGPDTQPEIAPADTAAVALS